ncbi:uncharacterized protein METZ01_LOCUS314362, partial [marine metagenome]
MYQEYKVCKWEQPYTMGSETMQWPGEQRSSVTAL